jgi:hypothetical protein
MRRASHRLALLGLAALALGLLPASAAAAPKVTLKVKAVPIPVNPNNPKGKTYPGTGNILGAGAALESKFVIKGTEYGGFPLPLKQVVFYLPAGTKLHTGGFAKCSEAILQTHEIQNCPKKSIAGPTGTALGVVSFGGTRVPETVHIHSFFTAKGLAFFVEGNTPASIEILSTGNITGAGGGFAQKLTAEVPLVATVPGAPFGSVEEINVEVGAAFKHGKKLISYGTVPRKCPKGGFKVKAELTFGASEGPTGEKVTVTTIVPCPKK